MLLRPATPDEKVRRDRLTFSEWGATLSLEQYLDRELHLRAHAFSKGMQTWFWCDGPRVLASCETYENDSRVGEVSGVSFSVASVFTQVELRGRGHATQMMTALLQRLRGQACVLFSDVGAPLYERSGFTAVPEEDWVLPALAGGVPEDEVEPLKAPLEISRAPPSDGSTLVLTPTAAQLDWALERERLYARFGSRTRPSFSGARADGATALWAASYKHDELLILYLDGEHPTKVLRAAQRQAHRCGLNQVRIWGTKGAIVPGAEKQKRDGELPMFAALGDTLVTRWADVQRALWV